MKENDLKTEMTAPESSVGADAEQSSQINNDNIIPDYDEEFNTDFFDDDCYSDLRLIRMSDIKPQEVEWLWEPYIPQGKITIIQGDPGEGKTTLALALAASLSTGKPLWNGMPTEPASVIYQTAEDGLADTVRPRLDAMGADCGNVFVIDESQKCLSLSDKRIEDAIESVHAKLFILDPIQAYLGADVDMHRANEVRPLLHAFSQVAERTGCTMVLIAHIGKKKQNALRRSLGTMDIPAAARSILFVGHTAESRMIAQVKNSLHPLGRSLTFGLDGGFHITGESNMTAEELCNCADSGVALTKGDVAVEKLIELLSNGPMPSEEVFKRFEDMGIGKRTVSEAKKAAGVKSVRKDGIWHYEL